MTIAPLTLDSTDKKIRIMAATVELVAENGIHATPMSKVSKRANVAAGTIYHYFENKDALIRETYLYIKNANVYAILAVDNSNDDYKTRFLRFWQVYYKRLLLKGQLSFLEQCAISPLIDEETLAQIDEHGQSIVDFIEMGKQEKYIKDLPDNLLYNLTFGTVASTAKLSICGCATQIEPQQELTPDDIRQASEFCWDGIKAN